MKTGRFVGSSTHYEFPDTLSYLGKEKVNLRAMAVVDNLLDIRSQMLEGVELLDQYAEDGVAQFENTAQGNGDSVKLDSK